MVTVPSLTSSKLTLKAHAVLLTKVVRSSNVAIMRIMIHFSDVSVRTVKVFLPVRHFACVSRTSCQRPRCAEQDGGASAVRGLAPRAAPIKASKVLDAEVLLTRQEPMLRRRRGRARSAKGLCALDERRPQQRAGHRPQTTDRDFFRNNEGNELRLMVERMPAIEGSDWMAADARVGVITRSM